MTATPAELDRLKKSLEEDGYLISTPLLSGHGTTPEDLRKTPVSSWLLDAESAYQELIKNNDKIFLGGISFGSILALWLAGKHPDKISALALLSPPFKLASSKNDFLLNLISYLPEKLLGFLGYRNKSSRDIKFLDKRIQYDKFPLGAVARMIKLRRLALEGLGKITCPIIIAQDPNDHHVSPQSPETLSNYLKNNSQLTTKWFKGAEHEMTIGPKAEEVCGEIVTFFNSTVSNA